MKRNSRTIVPSPGSLRGSYTLPGDKSISHRALFFGAIAGGLEIHGLAPGNDVVRTRQLVEGAGYPVHDSGNVVTVGRQNFMNDRLQNPIRIEAGNSGTTARLGLGFLAGERGLWKMTGDASLKQRPMARVLEPLRQFGAHFRGGPDRLPVSVIADHLLGADPIPTLDVTSAQVHASLLLAGLRSSTGLRLRRTVEMRDHTLRIGRLLDLPVTTVGDLDTIAPCTDRDDTVRSIEVPGDFSSAAFLITATLLQPDAEITIEGVGLNPTRTAFLHAVRSLGADVEWRIEQEEWEPVGSIRVKGGAVLTGRLFSSATDDMHGMADEIPLLALLAATAVGGSEIRDAGELRVKESDRISATVTMLRALGLSVEEREDGFRTSGGGLLQGGCEVDPSGDHRLAMLAGIAALASREPVAILDPEVASVSWPRFWEIIG